MFSKKINIFIAALIIQAVTAQRDNRLPYSHGPGPLFSFGLNVQPKKSFIYRQIYTLDERDFTSRFILHNHVYYGITDHFTLVIKQPIILKRRNEGVHTRGIGNIRIEIETIPYVYQIPNKFRFRITTVSGIIPPTTTTKYNGYRTLHSIGFFLGVTQSNTTPRIFQYSGIGIFIPTTEKNRNERFNNGIRLFCELGFGHAVINNDTIFVGLNFEISGEYQESKTINKIKDFTTGNSTIFYGPTIRVSTEKFIGQIGFQYPWVQHLKSIPLNPTNYRLAIAGALHFTF